MQIVIIIGSFKTDFNTLKIHLSLLKEAAELVLVSHRVSGRRRIAPYERMWVIEGYLSLIGMLNQ